MIGCAADNRCVCCPHPTPHWQEFQLNGSTPEERAAREHKAAERRARIVADIQEDEATLPELRWPYASSCAPVSPTPPPLAVTDNCHYQTTDGSLCGSGGGAAGLCKPAETLAVQLRAAKTRQELAAGRFDSQEER